MPGSVLSHHATKRLNLLRIPDAERNVGRFRYAEVYEYRISLYNGCAKAISLVRYSGSHLYHEDMVWHHDTVSEIRAETYRSSCLLTVRVRCARRLDGSLALEAGLAVVEEEKEILDDVLVLRECSL